MSHPWNAIFFVLVNAQHKFYMSSFIGLLCSIKNKYQKLVPTRGCCRAWSTSGMCMAARAELAWIKKRRNSSRKTEGEFWVSVIPTHHSLCDQRNLERKGGKKSLFLFWQSPSVCWTWLKWACLSRHNIKWRGRDVIRAIIQIHCSCQSFLPGPKTGLAPSLNCLVRGGRRRWAAVAIAQCLPAGPRP